MEYHKVINEMKDIGAANASLKFEELEKYLLDGWKVKQIEFKVLNMHNNHPSHLLICAWLEKPV